MSRSWSHPAWRISAIAAVRRSISRPNVALMPMRTCSVCIVMAATIAPSSTR